MQNNHMTFRFESDFAYEASARIQRDMMNIETVIIHSDSEFIKRWCEEYRTSCIKHLQLMNHVVRVSALRKVGLIKPEMYSAIERSLRDQHNSLSAARDGLIDFIRQADGAPVGQA